MSEELEEQNKHLSLRVKQLEGVVEQQKQIIRLYLNIINSLVDKDQQISNLKQRIVYKENEENL